MRKRWSLTWPNSAAPLAASNAASFFPNGIQPNLKWSPGEPTMSSFLDLLTPDNSQLLFIDQQPQMAFGVQSIDRQTLKNNVVALAKTGKIFDVPTTITTVETESFSGHTYPELLAVLPTHKVLERTSMNSWDDQNVRDALAATGRN